MRSGVRISPGAPFLQAYSSIQALAAAALLLSHEVAHRVDVSGEQLVGLLCRGDACCYASGSELPRIPEHAVLREPVAQEVLCARTNESLDIDESKLTFGRFRLMTSTSHSRLCHRAWIHHVVLCHRGRSVEVALGLRIVQQFTKFLTDPSRIDNPHVQRQRQTQAVQRARVVAR